MEKIIYFYLYGFEWLFENGPSKDTNRRRIRTHYGCGRTRRYRPQRLGISIIDDGSNGEKP